MRVGEGYNSAVEYHLDVVEVISSSLIIPKPNVSPSIYFFFYFMTLRIVGGPWYLHDRVWMAILEVSSGPI